MNDVVGLRFVTEGATEAIRAMERYNLVQNDTVSAIKNVQSAASRIERDLRTLNEMYQGGARQSAAYTTAVRELKRQFAELSGTTIQKANAEITKLSTAMDEQKRKAEELIAAQQRAETAFALAMQRHKEETAAAEEAARVVATAQQNYDRLAASLDPVVAAKQRFQQAMEVLNEALKEGVIGAQAYADQQERLLEILERDTTDPLILEGRAEAAKAAAVAHQEYYESLMQADLAQKSAKESAETLMLILQQEDAAAENAARAYQTRVNALIESEQAHKSAKESAETLMLILQAEDAAAENAARAYQTRVNALLESEQAHKSAKESAETLALVFAVEDAVAENVARAHQSHINALIESEQAHKSAKESAETLMLILQQEDAAAENAARAYQDYINNLLGVEQAQARAAESAKTFKEQFAAEDAFNRLTLALDPAAAALDRFNQRMDTLRQAEERGIGTTEQHEQARRRIQQAYDAEIAKVSGVAEAQRQAERVEREATQAKQQAARAYDQLLARIDPVVAAQQRFAQTERTVENAVRSGVITKQQGIATMEAYRASLTAMEQAALRTDTATDKIRQQFLATANSIAILDGPLGGIASRFSAFGVLIGRIGIQLGVLAVGFTALGATIGVSIRQAAQAETAQLSLEAAVRATGGAAGVTARQIEGLARAIEAETLAAREGVRQAATQLLTFESITGEMFERTLRISQDIAQVFGRDMVAVSFQVAKALENPAQSLASLERAYGALRPGLRATAVAMMEQGRAAEAMDLVMADLERRFQNMGAEAAAGLAGEIDTLQSAMTDLRDRVFEIVNGSDRVQNAFAGVTSVVVLFTNSLETLVRIAQAFAVLIGARGAIAVGIRTYTALATAATAATLSWAAAMRALSVAISATGLGLLAVALGTTVAWFDRNRNSANLLRQELDRLRDASQENIGTAGSLVAELQRLGTVNIETARAHLERANAVRIGIMADIEAMRIAVMNSREFQRLAEREQRLQRDLERGRFRRGGAERAREALEAVRVEMTAMLDSVIDDEASQRLASLAVEVSNLLRALDSAEGDSVRIGEGARRFATEVERSVEAFIARAQLQKDELDLLNQGLSVAEARLALDQRALEKEVEKIEAAAALLRGQDDLNEETRKQIETFDRMVALIRNGLIPSLRNARDAANFKTELDSTLDGLMEQNEVLEVQIRMLQSGVDFVVAQRLAEVQLQKERAKTLLLTQDITSEMRAQLLTQIALLAIKEAEIKRNIELVNTVASFRPTGGGGGRTQELITLEKIEAQMILEQQRRLELLQLGEQERMQREIFFDIIDQLDAQGVAYTEAEVMRTAERIAALQREADEYERRLEQSEQLAQRLGQTLGNLFMAATKGADAFRQALSGLLNQLASMLANAAFTNLFSGSGFLGALGGLGSALLGVNAKGNAFSNGSVVPFADGAVIANMNSAPAANVVPFARGGIVDRPTMFPMRGAQTGLMGEAGPEAIMPLKRGRDGKLGVASQPQQVQVDVRVHMDENGNWKTNVERIADQRVQRQGSGIVRQAVAATYAANRERKMR